MKCLLKEKVYKETQILQGIRRSCKGEAVDILRRLGPGIRVEEIFQKFEKFESTYGKKDTVEMTLKKLHASQQNQDESVTTYAAKRTKILSCC